MPCYTAWNERLRPGTPEYLRAEAEVRAKLESDQAYRSLLLPGEFV